MKTDVVLSLFDGMSCAQIALKVLGANVGTYFASEIDKHCHKVTQHNFPNTIQLGDVRNVSAKELPPINLIVGGSPCTGFSFAGKMLAFDDPQSKLFFEFVRILNEARAINPDVKFLLENTKMPKVHELVISRYLGVAPIEINSNLVSAQNRTRNYWTNIANEPYGLFGDMRCTIPHPKDKGILLKDILETDVPDKYYLSEYTLKKILKKFPKINPDKAYSVVKNNNTASFGNDRSATLILIKKNGKEKPNQDKASCFTAGGHSGGNHSDMHLIIVPEATKKGFIEINPGECFDFENPNSKTRRGRKMTEKSNCLMAKKTDFMQYTIDHRIRRLTPIECKKLQTIPDWYKMDMLSDTQIYKQLGNGWTIDVIAHILSYL